MAALRRPQGDTERMSAGTNGFRATSAVSVVILRAAMAAREDLSVSPEGGVPGAEGQGYGGSPMLGFRVLGS
jgi:hypothetical protein